MHLRKFFQDGGRRRSLLPATRRAPLARITKAVEAPTGLILVIVAVREVVIR
jgi:hypothetical protein